MTTEAPETLEALFDEAILGDVQMELRLHKYQGEMRVGWRLWPEGWEEGGDFSYRPEAGGLEAQLRAVMAEARSLREA